MSWKSLVTAGLLCIIASPAFAVPTLKVTNGGLDADGNWIWNVTIAATTGTSPVAGEIGLKDLIGASGIVSVERGAAFTGANTQNPGTQIFTWETPDAGANNRPVGVQANCTGCTIATAAGTPNGIVVAGTLDEIFASMGSLADLPASDTPFLTVKTSGPIDTRLTTSIGLEGAYGAGGNNGRVAEITSGTNATNYDNFNGTATRTVVVGDVNLSGVAGGGAAVTIADFSTLVQSLNKALGPRNWSHGDLNGTTGGTEVTIADFSLLVGCLNKTTPACSGSVNTPINIPGAGAGGGALAVGAAAVPEPASVALVGLGFLGVAGLFGRRRRS